MNTRSQLRFASLLLFALTAAACGGAGDAPAPTASPAPADAAPQPVEAPPAASAQGKYLRATPGELENCKQRESVEISWDLAGDFPGVTGVQIFVGPDEEPKLFSSGGASGTTRTGQWTRVGSTFRLVNKKSGEEIERIVIGGPAC